MRMHEYESARALAFTTSGAIKNRDMKDPAMKKVLQEIRRSWHDHAGAS
jgi:hypothetical protein